MPRKDRDPLHPPKILIVLHQETSTPGRVGQMLTRRGYLLDIRRPRLGDDLPDTLAGHDGAVVFGGPMSCNDDEDYIRREIDWLAVPLREAKPYLGICLGAQMLARQLGAPVGPHAHGRVEIGYYPIRPTEPGKALMKWPAEVYQWHREGFDLPRGATLLAEGDDFPNQAYRYGPAAYGIQFHPELTLAMMYRWTTFGAPRFALPGAQGRDHHFDGRARADAAVRLWLDRFLDLWLDPCGAAAREASNDDRSVAIVAAE
jgi:GMP synthase (glutamine-hydrolysing)